ncbi:rab-protein geranylgeranyltransferase [Collybia nuda]|uniref:Geranylgeranyl transferase type-2 subunit alpha n=1 Tax=Collybia nuda TaxID=64659 RepID=A0A9P5XXQ0_9AGAR|nr:rab-protein geranylgeranyltransferase [Collybia nuda]
MHGIKRVHQSPEAAQVKKLRDQAKIQEYLALTDEILSRKKNQDWSVDAFRLTSRLLQINPEFYTVWNYRRNILILGIFPHSSLQDVNNFITDDLSMTTAALRSHPKVYWIWNHRRWCLENVPNGPGNKGENDYSEWKKGNWDKEIYVVEKILDADPRNFHAWNYRRYILASMPVSKPLNSELHYTARKIEANLSNFSAWHQRSKILAILWDGKELFSIKSKEDELELAKNAMYTDPDDQSVWVYHRLMRKGNNKILLEREVSAIQELLDEQPDSKWCMESIVHYTQLLLRNHASSVDSPALTSYCQSLLGRLQRLDPLRQHRYKELGVSK